MKANEKWEWRDACKETTGREELCLQFDYIGDEMVVFSLSRKHTKCEARWKEYFAQYANVDDPERYLRFYGYEYR